jgi:hypothetical protein
MERQKNDDGTCLCRQNKVLAEGGWQDFGTLIRMNAMSLIG